MTRRTVLLWLLGLWWLARPALIVALMLAIAGAAVWAVLEPERAGTRRGNWWAALLLGMLWVATSWAVMGVMGR